jgi:branched-chain amino acid transport system ATP-binding protein
MSVVDESGIALAARGVSISFNGFHAVDEVDLTVRQGGVHAVIGPNGAGKSTLFNLITGELRATGGTVTLRGTDITGKNPARIARLGLSRAFQITNIFPNFTVQESLELAVNAAKRHTLRFLPFRASDVPDEVDRVLEIVGLAPHRHRLAKELSHGDQRALEVALALALRPEVLLLDEPTAGMAPSETGRITELIRDLVDKTDVTVLFCEHDVPMVFGVSDYITVMHQGKVLVEGTPEQIRGNEEVREVYLGVDEE